jgi:hypothetical protein
MTDCKKDRGNLKYVYSDRNEGLQMDYFLCFVSSLACFEKM